MTDKIDEKTGEIKQPGQPRPYYFGGKNIARKVTHPTCEPGLAKQEFKKECDINVIMEKYKATGLIPQQVAGVQGHFADFTTVDDFYTAQIKTTNAQKAFDLLPSKLRKIFDNDPAKLVDFISNPKNKLAAAKMGLLTPEATSKAYSEALEAREKQEKDIVNKAEAKKAATAAKDQKPGPKGSE
jgi:phage internal scaffolding protein